MSEIVHNGPTDDEHARGRTLRNNPGDEDDAPPETQLLPLDAWHRARGARMVEFAGYHMPIQYDGIMPEYAWTRESAGLFDVSHMGQLLFSGTGADAGLETLLPGDIITTGTPPGVGMGAKPAPVYLQAGDTMRVAIEKLGEQRQRVVAWHR